MRLTDAKVRSAKALDRPVKLFDGGGLYLELSPNGSKLWRLKYRFNGKDEENFLRGVPVRPACRADGPCNWRLHSGG
jgi:hypothetical protein